MKYFMEDIENEIAEIIPSGGIDNPLEDDESPLPAPDSDEETEEEEDDEFEEDDDEEDEEDDDDPLKEE